MNGIERRYELRVEGQNIGLNKGKRIVRLRLDVYPDHLEACAAVPDPCTTGTTEKVEEPGLRPGSA